ncbi:alpha/beta hydrolase [Ancylomarina sp.]|uniref:alpha/beta hydrolase n=1 Tax=Ancylomarina sp. TaxID=1970196 RepID=UPI003566828D
MRNMALVFIICSSLFACNKQIPLSFIDYPAFQSKYIPARDVKVMLPPDYDAKRSYPVIYMHDGQMLFDRTTTWNKQEWGVDETVDSLIKTQKIRPVIVVAISHTNNRSLEYMPNKPQKELKLIDRPDKFKGEILSDEYLKFLVEELKPFIDKNYSTQTDRENTFILGSSMGGLISCYAISEYPNVFGGAACMSTHWPALNGVFLKYVAKNLPDPQTHKIYFDYGTETLDSLYKPYQLIADKLMKERGYSQNENWVTRKFEGAKHDENAWRDRLHIPLQFLLSVE